MMDITIIGSGAMGALFGGFLTEDGNSVTLVDIWEEHVRAMNDRGLTIVGPKGTERKINVEATSDFSSLKTPELVVFFVKSTDTKKAAEDASSAFDENVDVLTLQNGLGNPEAISNFFPEEKILAGTTSHGSTLKSPGSVVHAGVGPTKIGRYFVDNNEDVYSIAKTLSSAGFETEVSENVKREIWEKLLVNVGINPPTALARVRNGLLTETDLGVWLIDMSVREARKVAEAEGISVRGDIFEHVKRTASSTGANKSSMLQDIEAGEKTEVDKILGEIVRRGKKHDIDTPVNEVLHNLILLAEHGKSSKRPSSNDGD